VRIRDFFVQPEGQKTSEEDLGMMIEWILTLGKQPASA